MKLSTYAEQQDIQYRAAWNRFKAGKIPGAYKNEYGKVIVPDPEESKSLEAVIYARVSSNKQKEDLNRQAERLTEFATVRGYTIKKVVKEIASGVNDRRPKLTRLLENDEWGIIIVEHKDRLSRVGFNWFNILLEQQNKKIIVVNEAEEETKDLMDDFLSIIYSFSARLYGLRAAKNRTLKLIEVLEKEKETIKTNA